MTALSEIAGPDRAAVMVMILEDAQASRLLAQLEPDELRLLGERMVALGEIGPSSIVDAIAGFVEHADTQGLTDHGRFERVSNLMIGALGELKADNLMKRIAPEGPPKVSPIEIARWLNADVLVPLIRDEPPQAIAVLLVQLNPDVAAQVLHALPDTIQSAVVHRVATLGPVSAEAIAMLEAVLAQRIGERHGAAPLELGGVQEAAAILNASARTVEKRVMPEIAKLDKALARTIEGEMFKFEHLFALDDKAMGALLREVESERLIAALKGIGEDQRELFFRAMSSRAADGLRDEIAQLGRMKMAEVIEAQKAIVTVARRLAAEGVIVFGAGDDDYV
ncbi:flagellar motor switch protein FliG [Novosphingobium sp.]|uniref:flagellar motor switch protein FliG n=1 Tax=Novosphingobium sp. TaxID=1874826 RepID=UPI0025F51F41|nr:flagellar motor switch protein FliG [Novosphingobium sp.]